MKFGKYLNPANAITASRYFCLPPFLFYLDRGMMQHATLWLLICGVLDLLDGPAARLFRCSSGFGEFFDAITDGICYAFAIICLCIYGKLPWIPIIALLVTGAFNAWMRAAYAKRAGRQTNYRSYAMERMVAYTAYAAGLGVAEFEPEYYAWLIPFAMLIIIIHDFKRMLIESGARAMIVSSTVYEWFVVVMLLFISIFTASRDAVILTRLTRKPDKTPEDRDLRFGTLIGIAICLYGLFGLVKHYYL